MAHRGIEFAYTPLRHRVQCPGMLLMLLGPAMNPSCPSTGNESAMALRNHSTSQSPASGQGWIFKVRSGGVRRELVGTPLLTEGTDASLGYREHKDEQTL